MYQVFYRRFRPKTFAAVINQEHVKATLTNAVTQGRIGHAYLFSGPRGVGKTTVARLLAKVANCEKGRAEPCNACECCVAIDEGRFLDLVEIDAASHTGVDNIREIIEHVKFTPSKGRFKVFIIDEVHMLSKGAFNALLKTLEEPPAHAIFILATTEIHKVPATIVSRTQHFAFRRVSPQDILALLERVQKEAKLDIPQSILTLAAESAGGSFRDALSLFEQIAHLVEAGTDEESLRELLGFSSLQEVEEFAGALLSGNTQETLAFFHSLLAKGRDLQAFHRSLLSYLRRILFWKISGELSSPDLLPQEKKRIAELAESIGLPKLMSVIEIFLQFPSLYRSTMVPELPFELAILEATKSGAEVATPSEGGTAPKRMNVETKKAEPSLEKKRHDADLLTRVQNLWSDILEKVKEYNHGLLSTMKLARAVGMEQGRVVLTVPYKFHHDTLESPKNKIVIEQAMEDAIGQKVLIKSILEREWKE